MTKPKVLRRKSFFADDEATTVVEYAVMLFLIAAVCITAIQAVGGNGGNFWSNNASSIDQALEKTNT